MFLTMFYEKQNIVLTMPLTMLIAHPYTYPLRVEVRGVTVTKKSDMTNFLATEDHFKRKFFINFLTLLTPQGGHCVQKVI